MNDPVGPEGMGDKDSEDRPEHPDWSELDWLLHLAGIVVAHACECPTPGERLFYTLGQLHLRIASLLDSPRSSACAVDPPAESAVQSAPQL